MISSLLHDLEDRISREGTPEEQLDYARWVVLRDELGEDCAIVRYVARVLVTEKLTRLLSQEEADAVHQEE